MSRPYMNTGINSRSSFDMKLPGVNMQKRLTTTLAEGNFSARNLELTPTEQPMSRMSLISHLFPEYFKW